MLYPEYLRLDSPLIRLVQNTRIMIRPESYRREMKDALSVERYRGNLPKLSRLIGRASVDVFGNHQSYAIFNSLNYHPRPALQSYAACGPALMQLNESFYRSEAAPEYVLLDLAAIDHRFPALEDALLFRHLLINYDLMDSEGQFLLLKSARCATAKLTLLAQGTVEPGQPVDLSPYGDAIIWLQFDIEPTAVGHLRQFLYKPGEVNLAVWNGPSSQPTKVSFRSPVPMLAAGFLASPMLTNRDEVRDLYLGKPFVAPSAYSVEFDGSASCCWRPTVRFRVYRIENLCGGRSLGEGQMRIAGALNRLNR